MEKYSNIPIYRISEATMDLGTLALYLSDTMMGVYTPSKMYEALEDGYDPDKALDAVQAAAQLRYNNKHQSWEVDSIAAKQGLGPLVYLIAMKKAGDEGLIPNRTAGVSTEAKRVWQEFYEGKGQKYVTFEPLEGQSIHGEPWLNARYKLDTDLNIEKAQRRNQRVLSNDPYREKEDLLQETFDSFLRNIVGDLY